ncbi:TetR/AcrR family transcriptional regulator [Gordonia aurantiaca]|uniref:TetR/AcrR family transcriptional regulator n=1 Tax=Gordonia sp. B21 TaxID=3151852 RepID=UPI003264A5B6
MATPDDESANEAGTSGAGTSGAGTSGAGTDDRAPRSRAGRSTRNRPSDDELLDAACEVIAEVGAERATMTAIAEHGGTTRVTLYAHFGSRDALVSQVISRELDTFTSFMFRIYDESDDMAYGARARHSVQGLFDYARRHPAGLRVLMGQTENGDGNRRLYAALEPRIAARLRENYAEQGARIAAGADTLASLLLGMSLHVAHRALIVDGAGIDEACDIAITATLAVLRDVRPEQLQALDASLERR